MSKTDFKDNCKELVARQASRVWENRIEVISNTENRHYGLRTTVYVAVRSVVLLMLLVACLPASSRAQATTTMAITFGGAPVTSVAAGSVVTLTASVKTNGTAVKTGQVEFCDALAAHCADIHLLGTAQLTSVGTAAIKLRPGIGSHSYRAVFLGTISSATSASTSLPLAVTGRHSTTTSILESGSPGNYALNATVSGIGGLAQPTSMLSFLDTSNGDVVLATATLNTGSSVLGLANSQSLSTGSGPYAITVADFNGDGIPDLAVTDNSRAVSVFLGNGDGTFSLSPSPATGIGPISIVAGDFNGDGNTDLAVANYGDNTVTVLLGNGDGTFKAEPIVATGQAPYSVVAGDFNHDGILDLATANYGSNSVSILLGNGDGTFRVAPSPAAGNNPQSIAVADFNGDGTPDLAVTNYGNNTVTVLPGKGDGTFAPAPSKANTGGYPISITAGDFNGDGRADLAVANNRDNTISVLLGNGDGTFKTAPKLATGTNPTSVAVGDFNGDGTVDLVISNGSDNSVTIFLGKGDGTFTAAATSPVMGSYPVFVAAGDFNGDGDSDLAAVIPGNAVTVLLSKVTQQATAASTGISPVGAGQHLVLASYSGDSNYAPSASGTVSLISTSAATPVFNPGGGAYTSPQTVTITDATPGAAVYYTTNGTAPTTLSNVYARPIMVSSTETLEAIAIASGYSKSAISAAAYAISSIPELTQIFPSTVQSGSPATQISVLGGNFTSSTKVVFNGQAIGTTFVSSMELTATIPAALLVQPGSVPVNITNTGGTSTTAEFVISPAATAARVVILAAPVGGGSATGPWQVSAAVSDAGGNVISGAPLNFQVNAGTITPSSATTNELGVSSAIVAAPASYAGEAVAVQATSGNVTAVANISFVPGSSSIQQAATASSALTATDFTELQPADASSTTGNGSSVTSPMVVGMSGTPGSANGFAAPNPCFSNAGLGTTMPVDCQSVLTNTNIKQVIRGLSNVTCHLAVPAVQAASCAGVTIVGAACAVSAVAPETGAPVVCAGGISYVASPDGDGQGPLTEECMGLINSMIVRDVGGTATDQVAMDVTQSSPSSAGEVVGLICDAVDAESVSVAVSPSAATVPLGNTFQFSANSANVHWIVNRGTGGDSSGTISNEGLYTAPPVFPLSCFGLMGSGSCPVIVTAISNADSSEIGSATITLVDATTIPLPIIQSISPNTLVAGSGSISVFINGKGFLETSQSTFNGLAHPVQFLGPNQLKISLSESEISSPGSALVVVTNPAPGGGSSSKSVSVGSVAIQPPPVPTPESPGTSSDTGSSVNSTTPTLGWNGSETTQYEIAISEYPYGASNLVYDASSVNGGTSILEIPFGVLQNGAKYRWDLRAYNNAGSSSWSSPLYFSVNAGSVSPIPIPQSPGSSGYNGDTINTTTPSMEWNGSEATLFELAISQSPYGADNVVYDAGAIGGSLSSLTVPPEVLENGVEYRWDIRAYNAAGWSNWSNPLYFSVNAGSTPSVPAPQSPGTKTDTGVSVNSITPTMNWSGSGATQFELAIFQFPYGSGNVVYDVNSAEGNLSTLAIPSGVLQNGVKYRWDMRAYNAAGWSSWSSPLYFTVSVATAPTISSVSPNPVTGSNSQQPFTINGTGFTSQSTVTLYDVTAGQSFPNRAISSQTSTQIVINPDFTTAAHSWWVEVFNGSLGSNQYSFQVVAPATAPTISSVSPNPVTGSNSQQPFTINGTGFTSQSTVTLYDVTAGQSFPNRAIGSQTSTQIVINPDFTTAAHSWWVEVFNGSLGSNQYSFQVVAPATAPTISSVSPNPVTGSNSQQPFTINGTGFTSQSTVTLYDVTAGQSFPNRAISSQTSTQIVINPDFTTAAHSWWVEVFNGSLGSNQYSFQVVAPATAPTISSVSPNPVTGSNSQQPFTINGTGFTSQSTVTLYDVTAGQSFPNRAISSQTSTQIVINPDFTTAAHSWWVEVFNGSLGSNQYSFQVKAP